MLAQSFGARIDNSFHDEVPDAAGPGLEFFHVRRVEGAQPGQEVNGVALIDLPEDFVELADHVHELLVVVVEADRAHVLREEIGTSLHD